MEIIEKKITTNTYSFRPYDEYFKDLKTGVFDIETTGLSPDRCQIILAGLMMPTSTGSVIKQYFAQTPDEEAELITYLIEDLQALDSIVTYNGSRFDIPFLIKRMNIIGLPNVPLPYNLDLYKVVKYHSDLKKFLPNLKQKTLEDFCGLWANRDDEIDGGQSVKLYYDYVDNKNDFLKEKILLHNSDDVKQLKKLMNIISRTDFHKAMFSMGFPVDDHLITGIKITDSKFTIIGTQKGNVVDCIYFNEEEPSFVFSGNDASFKIVSGLYSKNGITFADSLQLQIETSPFDNDPAMIDNYIVLSENNNINYRAACLLARALLERINKKWIINK